MIKSSNQDDSFIKKDMCCITALYSASLTPVHSDNLRTVLKGHEECSVMENGVHWEKRKSHFQFFEENVGLSVFQEHHVTLVEQIDGGCGTDVISLLLTDLTIHTAPVNPCRGEGKG